MGLKVLQGDSQSGISLVGNLVTLGIGLKDVSKCVLSLPEPIMYVCRGKHFLDRNEIMANVSDRSS